MSVQALTEKSASPSDWTALVLIEKEALVGFGLGLALDPYVRSFHSAHLGTQSPYLVAIVGY